MQGTRTAVAELVEGRWQLLGVAQACGFFFGLRRLEDEER